MCYQECKQGRRTASSLQPDGVGVLRNCSAVSKLLEMPYTQAIATRPQDLDSAGDSFERGNEDKVTITARDVGDIKQVQVREEAKHKHTDTLMEVCVSLCVHVSTCLLLLCHMLALCCAATTSSSPASAFTYFCST